MANKVLLKKSSVSAKVPLSTDLEYGELALNYADGKLFFKDSSNTIQSFSTSTGSGGGSGSTFTFASTAPLSPSAGDEWLDSNTGVKYTYFDDGSSLQWVEMESDISISVSSGSTASSAYSNQYTMTGTTSNAVETEIFIGGVAGARIPVAVNTSMHYTLDFVCRHADHASGASFMLKGMVKNVDGTVSDVGMLYELIVVRTDPSLSVDVRSDNTNDTLNVYVTGNSSKVVNWKCAVSTVEV